MGWSPIRRATSEDMAQLDAAAERFERRHGIHPDNLDERGCWDGSRWLDSDDAVYLQRLWRRCVHRALQCEADGVAWGYVGLRVGN